MIQTLDGKEFVECLDAADNAKRFFRYTTVAGIPASHCTGTLEVTPKGCGSVAGWRVQFLGAAAVRGMLSLLVKTGVESLKSRFAVAA